jgi:hypothetical protein
MLLQMLRFKILLTKFYCSEQIKYSKLSKIYVVQVLSIQEFYCLRFMLFKIFLSCKSSAIQIDGVITTKLITKQMQASKIKCGFWV